MNAEIDITGVVLRTDRLLLRPWKNDDLADFFEYASVDGVGEMAGWSHHKSIEETRTILDLFIREKKTFAVEYNGKVIGSLGIEKYDEKELPEFESRLGREIGFVLSKDYWGNGYMQEAVNAVIDFLFNNVGLDFIICCHFAENVQSKRVQEKCRFKYYKNRKFKTGYGAIKDDCVNILFR